MQKYRRFAEIPKAARGVNALSLWAKAELRHAISNPTRRSRSAVGGAERRAAREDVTLLTRNDRGFPAILSEIARNSRHFWLKRLPLAT